MAVNPHDPRPQATIRTSSGVSDTEPRGAYVDQALTTRNLPDQQLPNDPLKSGAKTLGNIRRYYASDKAEEIDQTAANPGVEAPEHLGNTWVPGHDLYKNDGNTKGIVTAGINSEDAAIFGPGEVNPS